MSLGISHYILNGYHSNHYHSFVGLEHYTYFNAEIAWSKTALLFLLYVMGPNLFQLTLLSIFLHITEVKYKPKYYGGINDDEGYSVKETDDGGYVIAGYTSSFGQGDWDVYILKVNAYGDLLWTKTYGGNRYDFANYIEVLDDGSFILTGVTSGFGTGSIIDDDLFLMKTDSLGNSIWANTYGGDASETGNSVKPDGNGFIAIGSTYSSGAGQQDVYLLKTDSTGNVIWSNNYGGASTEQGNDVLNHDGNYVMIGDTRNFSKGLNDVYLIKTDSLGIDSCNQETALTFVNYLPWIQGTGGTENTGGIVKSNSVIPSQPDTSGYFPCICVPPLADFEIGMTHTCGYFYNYSTWASTWYWDFGNGDSSSEEMPFYCWMTNGEYKVCLTVTNECGMNTYCDSVSAYNNIDEISSNRVELFIAPNPFDHFTIVKFKNINRDKLQLQIISLQNRIVRQFDNITGNNIMIEKNDLPAGMYFIQLVKEGQIIGADKIIISE